MARQRGWLFLTVENAEEIVANITEDFLYEAGGEEDYVIIRTEIVIGDVYNVVVPIDAQSPGRFHAAREEIEKMFGTTAGMELIVETHNPMPPHKADGYIGSEEYSEYPAPGLKRGRQHRSPGDNPWG